MVNLPVLAPDARKGRAQWLARGLASHATRLYAGSFGRNASIAVCGYPRSGTSWVSAILAAYYGLPVPRHYTRPQFYDHVLHGHDLRLGGIRRVFYMVRSPFDVFPSLFVKRYGQSEPTAETRAQFTTFLRSELTTPHEAPCPWADHVAAACRRHGAATLLVYSRNPKPMAAQLGRRIEAFDGQCDRNRLLKLASAPPTGKQAPTTVTPSLARQFNWLTAEGHALITEEILRLKLLCPDLDLTAFTGSGSAN